MAPTYNTVSLVNDYVLYILIFVSKDLTYRFIIDKFRMFNDKIDISIYKSLGYLVSRHLQVNKYFVFSTNAI